MSAASACGEEDEEDEEETQTQHGEPSCTAAWPSYLTARAQSVRT